MKFSRGVTLVLSPTIVYRPGCAYCCAFSVLSGGAGEGRLSTPAARATCSEPTRDQTIWAALPCCAMWGERVPEDPGAEQGGSKEAIEAMGGASCCVGAMMWCWRPNTGWLPFDEEEEGASPLKPKELVGADVSLEMTLSSLHATVLRVRQPGGAECVLVRSMLPEGTGSCVLEKTILFDPGLENSKAFDEEGRLCWVILFAETGMRDRIMLFDDEGTLERMTFADDTGERDRVVDSGGNDMLDADTVGLLSAMLEETGILERVKLCEDTGILERTMLFEETATAVWVFLASPIAEGIPKMCVILGSCG